MKKRIIVNVSGNYRDKSTTVKALILKTKQGKDFAFVNNRQIKAAADRCCYAGTDYPVFENLDGFDDWQSCGEGIVCYKL